MNYHPLTIFLPAAACLAWAGCGRTQGMYPASGKVLYRGEPAVGASVFFHRTGGPGPAPDVVPSGVVGEDGGFRLSSVVGDGAPAGQYNVLVAWPDRSATRDRVPGVGRPAPGQGVKAVRTAAKIRPSPSLPPDRLKGRYSDPDHPRLKAEIRPETNSLTPFEIAD